MPKTLASGKLCCSPSEITMPSSVAAACSSKSKLTQKRLRSANPQARLMAPPNGACRTSCMPPLSSKKRSATMVSHVGTVPSTASVARTYSTICSAPPRSTPHSAATQAATGANGDGATPAINSRLSPPLATACAAPPPTSSGAARVATSCTRAATSARSRDTTRDSSNVRAGDSPSQNGIVGGVWPASSTRTRPASTRRMRHEWLPRMKMSPAMLSTAKSSFTLPTSAPAGSSTTS